MTEHIRLRFIAPLRRKSPPIPLEGEVAFLPMEAIGEDGTYDHASVRSSIEVADAGYTYFEQGDVIRARVTPCFENRKGAFLSTLFGERGVGTTELFVFNPSPQIDPVFLYYTTISEDFTGRGAATMYGAHGVRRVDDRFVRDYRVWLPSITRQRAIADHLERVAAKIDQLLSDKSRLSDLLDKWYWSAVTQEIEDCSPSYAPLRRFLTRITDGPFGSALTSNDYSDSGARVVRLGNIGRGYFRDDDRAFIDLPYFQTLLRHRILPGDLLIAGLGDRNNPVGRACAAPNLGAAIVKADCYCASVDRRRGNAEFLALYLSSPLGQRHTALAARGTTRSRINLDIARSIEVPDISISEQKKILEAAAQRKRDVDSLQGALQKQIKLLGEYRVALITAAVTGQLDVPEAA